MVMDYSITDRTLLGLALGYHDMVRLGYGVSGEMTELSGLVMGYQEN